MPAGDRVRSKIYACEAAIRTFEAAMRDAETPNALHAIVETLKEIANVLDNVVTRAGGAAQDQL